MSMGLALDDGPNVGETDIPAGLMSAVELSVGTPNVVGIPYPVGETSTIELSPGVPN